MCTESDSVDQRSRTIRAGPLVELTGDEFLGFSVTVSWAYAARRIFAALSCFAFLSTALPVAAQTGSSDSTIPPQNQPRQDNEPEERRSSRTDETGRSDNQDERSSVFSPIRLTDGVSQLGQGSESARRNLMPDLRRPADPGEFEKWVNEITGRKIKRFGADLLVDPARDYAVPSTTTIPPDYALNIGDTVAIAITGSLEGSVTREIDRNGEIFLPNIGSISLLGVRYRDLQQRIADAIGRQYRGYDVTVSIEKLRGIRVYVTGFANNPGAFTVTSLSTLVNAVLAAGGPSGGGSFRSIKLIRNGRELASYDLYELLRKGDRSRDPLLQNEDVLFIPPVGQQAAVIGSVNEEAIYETLPGESLADLLRLAGGPTNLADQARLILYSQRDQDTVGSREIAIADARGMRAAPGDIIQVLPQGTLVRPLDRQQVVVRLEGEVLQPGNYFVSPGTRLAAVLERAGGLSPRAYVYGTRLYRESVRAQQRRGYVEALDQMEMELAAAPLAAAQVGDTSERQSQLTAARSFLDRLREKEPDGRLVLELTPSSTDLPVDMMLENNDRIIVPPRVETVGVVGAVYRPASFLLSRGRPISIRDYVEKAGGMIRGADRGNVFVVRANGSVLTRKQGALRASAWAGDTIFVPIKTQSSSLFAKLRDIATLIGQFGLTAAALAAIQ